MKRIQLNPEQQQLFNLLDAKVRGYAEGVEAAKREFALAILAEQEQVPMGPQVVNKETS